MTGHSAKEDRRSQTRLERLPPHARTNRHRRSSSQPLLQIEEGEFATLLESNNFAVDDQLLLEIPGLICQLWKLLRDTPQIARENLDLLLHCDEAARGCRRICPPNKR